MAYSLGIDLGTTFSSAAVGLADGTVELINLGGRAPALPSVVVSREDGQVLFGEAAEARAIVVDPTRVAREFKRRLGDPTPLVLGGTPYTAQTLTMLLLRHIHDAVSERMNGRPASVVVCHPAAYSEYRLDVLRNAAIEAGIENVILVPEPLAAAAQYEARSQVAPGEVVAVYDFGGGTFDIALLRHESDGFVLLGAPVGVENLGGIDFDVAVLQHVNDVTDGALNALDPEDEATLAVLARLRRDCRDAKESLSSDSEAVVAVHVPGANKQVIITRAEFERLIAPRIGETLAALRRALESAGIGIDDIGRILLVGGSSRIPAIRDRVAIETGRPLAHDIDPEYAVALGAARLAATAARLVPEPAPTAPIPAPAPLATEPIPPPLPFSPPAPPRPRSRRPVVLVVGGIAAALALGTVAVLALGGGSEENSTATSPADVTVAPTLGSTPESTATTAADTTLVTDATSVTTVPPVLDGEQLLTLTGHTGPVQGADFSPDGGTIATASDDGTAKLWDASTGAELGTLVGHEGVVVSVDFSSLGATIVTSSVDKTARVWDVATLTQVAVLSGHTEGVVDAAFNVAGTQVVTAGLDLTARVWDVAGATEVVAFAGHTDFITSAAFSPDGSKVVTASTDGTARVWDVASGEQLQVFSGHANVVEEARFSPDGSRVVSAGWDDNIRIWDAATAVEVGVLVGHTSDVESAVFSADGFQILSSSTDDTARIWDVATATVLVTFTGHTEDLVGAEWDPLEARVVTASLDATAKVWAAP